ncbi:MAG: hypothetical protein GKR89_27315 [Candidatus Latescibacteria bacterium]|nr:hypothetical protein [Candidatus Latescibacterota bacterium]
MAKNTSSEHLLIDGYNLIKTIPRFGCHERTSLEAARRALQQVLVAFSRRTGIDISLYFDGDADDRGEGRGQPSLRIVFSRAPQTADDLIKAACQDKHGAKWLRVVSSDKEIRRFARRHRIRSVSAEEFDLELDRPVAGPQEGTEINEESLRERPMDEAEIDAWERLFAQGRDGVGGKTDKGGRLDR